VPRSLAYALGSRTADILLAVTPRKFDGLRDNLRHVLPEADDRTIRRVARRNLRNLSHSWINVMAMRSRAGRRRQRLRIDGEENVHAAVARGHGMVVVSTHFGAWETGLSMWNERGHPLALLAEELRPKALFERIAGARGCLGVQVIPLDVRAIREGDAVTARIAGMAAMREVFRVLRSGRSVAIAIDRDLTGSGTRMPFFGADASIPLGVVEVAIRSGAAIVPAALLPAGHGVDARVFPAIDYDPAEPRDAEVRRVTRVVLDLWEGLIRERPDLWYVLEPLWAAA
jgi:KDO2-lipid IV(A) lauroyltransferase